MLKYLQIINFAIIEKLELDLQPGLTVVTGETGAGKSIIIDALEIVLGSRTDASIIRQGTEKCEITLCVDIAVNKNSQEWLNLNEYEHENECIIRRIVHKDGRSKLSINGIPCSLQQMRDFSSTFIGIHSQNQQQLLLKKQYQREILDTFGGHQNLCQQVQNIYNQWRDVNQAQQKFLSEKQQLVSQIQLFRYQLDELDQIDVQENEYSQLDEEQKQLANAEKIINACHQTLAVLNESEPLNAAKLLNQGLNYLQSIHNTHRKISTASDFIQNARIQIDEAIAEVHDVLSGIEINPKRLEWVENRINKIHELSRKHHVHPHELFHFHKELNEKLQQLLDSDSQTYLYEKQLAELENDYKKLSQQLSKSRSDTAKQLNKIITAEIQKLGLPGAQFKADLSPIDDFTPQANGNEHIEFLITSNPGNPLQAMSKIASGGELSRIALAIYVTIAQTHASPVLIFDEVDVGIGGSTAAIVGRLLKKLTKTTQVLCITHLPQVASCGDHHLKVVKHLKKDQTSTTLFTLAIEEKVQEIARMLGGVTVTDKTIAHAREMLEQDIS